MEETSHTYHIVQAISEEQIMATQTVMRELRPHVPVDEYVVIVRRLMETNGYHLVALYDQEVVRAVAGYRFLEMLYCGKILYVDDLNTDGRFRSKGYGAALMNWLKHEAKYRGCGQLHLDSGVQRENTHRFYFREGLTINSYHFRIMLDI